MPAFEINGLHVVNGTIVPINEVLHDPNGPEAQADRAFILRSNSDKKFYYYEQINKTWILACISEGINSELNFFQLRFGAHNTHRLSMGELKVKEIFDDARRSEIKKSLLNIIQQYKVIDELTPKQIMNAAPIMTSVEETYTGQLSVGDRAVLNAVLENTGIEKPEAPADFAEGTEAWDQYWQTGLTITLTYTSHNIAEALPVNLPLEIKEMLLSMAEWMNPWRIDKLRFDSPADKKPMIGHVYDDIQRYFLKMGNAETPVPVINLTILSQSYYRIRVGGLINENSIVYTGLSAYESQIVRILCKDLTRFQTFLRSGGNSDDFDIMNEHVLSAAILRDLINIITPNSVKVDSEEYMFNDFYTISTIIRLYEDLSIFDDVFRVYIRWAVTLLKLKLEVLLRRIESLRFIQNPIKYLASLPRYVQLSIISTLSVTEILHFLPMPGFISEDNYIHIVSAFRPEQHVDFVQAVNIDTLQESIQNIERLSVCLLLLSEDAAIALINAMDDAYLSVIASSKQDLQKAFAVMKPSLITILMTKLWSGAHRSHVNSFARLKELLSIIPENHRMNFVKIVGVKNIVVHINSVFSLYQFTSKLTEPESDWFISQSISLLSKKFIKDMSELDLIFKHMPARLAVLILERLGAKIIPLVESSQYFNVLSVYFLSNVHIKRAYLYHSRYEMKQAFNPELINESIETLLNDVLRYSILSPKYFYFSSAYYLKWIINDCKDNVEPEKMLCRLRNTLYNIHNDYNYWYSFPLTRVSRHGSLAMILMYCIEQVNYHLEEAKPALIISKPTPIKSIILPKGVGVGFVSALGVGLALAFSPVSMASSLHTAVGAIIGLSALAALVTMALYVITVRSMTTKKDFTEQGFFASWSLSRGLRPVTVANAPLSIAPSP